MRGAGKRPGQSGCRRGPARGGRGGRGRWRRGCSHTSVSARNARGAPARSSSPPAGRPELAPPPPHAAPCRRRGGCWAPRPPLASLLCCLRGCGQEGVGRPRAAELTWGLAGRRARGAGEEWLGLGDSMRGPWTRRRSWDCPACARCGQPCSPCSPAGPKETGCEYAGGSGARGRRGAHPEGLSAQARGGEKGGPRAGDPSWGGDHLGLGGGQAGT